jgi:hypothetical protein
VEIIRSQSPEEIELEKKKAQLTLVEGALAQRELEFATVKAELERFEQRYLYHVGRLYVELDEIEALIAEAYARANPGDAGFQHRTEQAWAQARQSASETGAASSVDAPKFSPSASLQSLYRELAKRLHPDLTTDDAERSRRTRLMVEINGAYAAGDEARLRDLLRECDSEPEPQENTIGANLVSIIRKIAQAGERLRLIDLQIRQLKESELYQLKCQVEEAETAGRDLLREMAVALEQQIAAARHRLARATTPA